MYINDVVAHLTYWALNPDKLKVPILLSCTFYYISLEPVFIQDSGQYWQGFSESQTSSRPKLISLELCVSFHRSCGWAGQLYQYRQNSYSMHLLSIAPACKNGVWSSRFKAIVSLLLNTFVERTAAICSHLPAISLSLPTLPTWQLWRPCKYRTWSRWTKRPSPICFQLQVILMSRPH